MTKHLLRDYVVAHQVCDAVRSVAGELHDRAHIIFEIDEEPVWGAVRDQLFHL